MDNNMDFALSGIAVTINMQYIVQPYIKYFSTKK